jgi:hypothetical protein
MKNQPKCPVCGEPCRIIVQVDGEAIQGKTIQSIIKKVEKKRLESLCDDFNSLCNDYPDLTVDSFFEQDRKRSDFAFFGHFVETNFPEKTAGVLKSSTPKQKKRIDLSQELDRWFNMKKPASKLSIAEKRSMEKK